MLQHGLNNNSPAAMRDQQHEIPAIFKKNGRNKVDAAVSARLQSIAAAEVPFHAFSFEFANIVRVLLDG